MEWREIQSLHEANPGICGLSLGNLNWAVLWKLYTNSLIAWDICDRSTFASPSTTNISLHRAVKSGRKETRLDGSFWLVQHHDQVAHLFDNDLPHAIKTTVVVSEDAELIVPPSNHTSIVPPYSAHPTSKMSGKAITWSRPNTENLEWQYWHAMNQYCKRRIRRDSVIQYFCWHYYYR